MSPLSLALSNSKTPLCRIPFYYNHLTLRHSLAAKRIGVVNGIDIFENWKMPALGTIQTVEKHIKGQSVSCLIFHRLKETGLFLTKICETTLSKTTESFLYTHYSKRLPMDVDMYLLQTVYKTLMFASRKIYITGEIVLVLSTTG